MSQQQSQKRGSRSEAQKTERAREGYDPIPPSNAVAGTFGERESDRQTDQDTALSLDERRQNTNRESQQ